jgi:hypothetical protein
MLGRTVRTQGIICSTYTTRTAKLVKLRPFMTSTFHLDPSPDASSLSDRNDILRTTNSIA